MLRGLRPEVAALRRARRMREASRWVRGLRSERRAPAGPGAGWKIRGGRAVPPEGEEGRMEWTGDRSARAPSRPSKERMRREAGSAESSSWRVMIGPPERESKGLVQQ